MERNWIKVSPPITGAEDFVKPVLADGKKLALVFGDGKYFATQSYCPHAGADLSRGWCKSGKLICPHHRYEYDLVTGRGNPLQGDYIDVYPVEARADGIYVGFEVKKSLWERFFGK
ncbi:Rieske (2Fe-2S) protein [Hufsiella ginkgonis]|uniref:Rieske 2Fe-2S domain-containing protein n=1 Tax=Hufsiella ginkgonis TaxID=2695274 RepID=A0A7K1XXL1_9SPHI|nr:Rieske (2Fe-2S) protein [Hufsiella ginkgonis]MXV15673.1 Rieske 2Fe-2S domain-containing protein [Hufsiella ginkgonis]